MAGHQKQGFEAVLEISGDPQAFDPMVQSLVMGGRSAMLDLPAGKSQVGRSFIEFKGITIKGI